MQRSQILLVDPAAGGRQVLARLLRMSGFAVVEVASEFEARLAARRQRFDLLITEISNTGQPEFALIESLADLQWTRGIILTADDPNELPGWRKAGFSMLFRKPVDFDCLLAGVRQLVAGGLVRPDENRAAAHVGHCLQRGNYIGTRAAQLWISSAN